MQRFRPGSLALGFSVLSLVSCGGGDSASTGADGTTSGAGGASSTASGGSGQTSGSSSAGGHGGATTSTTTATGSGGHGGATTTTGSGGHGGATSTSAGGHGGATTTGSGGATTTSTTDPLDGGLGGSGGGGVADAGVDGGDDGGVVVVWPAICSMCHGEVDSPAPPLDLDGNSDTTAIGVGAHRAHLGPSTWRGPVACSDCHTVPSAVPDPAVPTHMDGYTQLAWSGLTKSGTFDPNAATCAGTYCHGATLDPDAKGKASNRAPQWTKVDGSQDACGTSCHTLPPGGKHPISESCPTCHGDVVSAFVNGPQPKVTWKSPKLHIDGQVELSALTCTSCHGDDQAKTPAPPVGTHGETQTSEPAVGAHSSHLAKSDWHRDVECADCHETPKSTSHSNGSVDLAWSATASADGAIPAFDGKVHACANVYCHGATLRGPVQGGSVKRTPIWTTVDGSFDACGSSCHTNPPGDGHPQSLDCPKCHVDVISSYTAGNPPKAVFADAQRHADGKIDVVPLDCTTCHGDPKTKDPAPPFGVGGEVATTEPAVGAHQQHLTDSDWHRTVECADCHLVPNTPPHASGMIDMDWGGPSANAGLKPVFSSLDLTCAGTYCHGNSLPGPIQGGVVSRTPVWTVVNGTYDACGSTCHTNPPAAPHPASNACPTCHTAVIAAYAAGNPPTVAWKDHTLHVDGKTDVVGLTCTSCHGDPISQDPAPPTGTHGESKTTDPAVGAHQAHLEAATWHRKGQCGDCHVVPGSPVHSDGLVKLDFGGPSTADGAVASFAANTLTCSNYCHGATLFGAKKNGAVSRVPLWTKVDGSYDACGTTCHTNPPGPPHVQNTGCPTCHGGVIASYVDAPVPTATWKAPELHVDGKVDLANVKCTSCHGDPVSGTPAPPVGTNGETKTTDLAVGAHQAHLGPADWHRTGQCVDCHKVPASIPHNDGVVDFAFGVPATADGAIPAFELATASCKSVYCHGTTLLGPNAGGVVSRTPVWTKVDGTYDACGTTCHTNPPAAPHPQTTACASCHDQVLSAYVPGSPPKPTWKDASLHVDGKVQVSPMTCTSCHGDPVTKSPAPPLGTKAEVSTSTRAVGAHGSHLAPSTWHKPVGCAECHVVPQSTLHSNGTAELAWGPRAAADAAKPLWTGATVTCSGVYCHGATLTGPNQGGVVKRSPVWTTVDGTFDACGTTCHTNPPGAPHVGSTDCAACHGAVVATYTPGNPGTATWTDANLHVDGVVQVAPMTCTSCHGDPVSKNPAPPKGTSGETKSSQPAVGAHAEHLTASAWHRAGQCVDCHAVPASMTHANGVDDLVWGPVSIADGAAPAYANLTCTGSYCHGATLLGPNQGGVVARTPVWTTVNGSFDACGTTCHTNPPGGAHLPQTDCAKCHGDVIASYVPGNPGTATWKDATRHVDGKVDLKLSCASCHGNPQTNDPTPPTGSKGETQTSQAAIGAHQQHLGASTWHRAGQCADCHVTPATMTHANGQDDLAWGAVSKADGAAPAYSTPIATCAGVYCHGATLAGPNQGGVVARTPVWTTVNGTFDACGTTCHTNPPGGNHLPQSDCAKCHGDVIASYVPGNPGTATWKDATRHVDGVVDLKLTCASCHGNAQTNDPAPPNGTKGETQTSQAAVGAHQSHLGASGWHRAGECVDCHLTPQSNLHQTGTAEISWGAPSNADGALPSWGPATLSCTGVYCHGATLRGAKPGGAVKREPIWTTVNGTYDACGSSCHTNPPGPDHPTHTDCVVCHASVVKTFDPGTNTATWTDATKHVDGVAQVTKYHDLAGWTSPKAGANHHGRVYFLQKQQKDEHGTLCSSCHGADFLGGSVGVSCDTQGCHSGGSFKSCTFCHGTGPAQVSPPLGVADEMATNTLAVGRHTAHLSASATHVAFACTTCHVVPAAGDTAHALQYVTSADLSTPGHHGDLAFTAGAVGMTWNVAATQGAPVTARGTCVGGCHSNGRGGPPVTTPYWAGGAWNTGSCGTCHAASPNTGEHGKHGGNGFACTDCHPAANSATHMDGKRTVLAKAGGGGITVTQTGGACGNVPTCTGTCHNKGHSSECW